MAQLIDIQRVQVGPQTLVATVRVADDGPLMTSEDLEGTTRVYNLLPGIIDHVCLGDTGETFKDVMGNTELAHLLEHATVELLAQSNAAGDVSAGRTRAIGDDGRTFEIELACPDDVLVAGALSSACWMLEWAYSGGAGAEPDVAATLDGLVALVNGLPEPPATPPSVREVPASPEEFAAVAVGPAAEAAAPTAAPLLSLVPDEPAAPAREAAPVSPAPAAGVPDAAVEEAPDVPPAESPEARQAAADVPVPAAVVARRAREAAASAPVENTSTSSALQEAEPAADQAPAPAPVPDPAYAPLPSVTGDIPMPRSVR